MRITFKKKLFLTPNNSLFNNIKMFDHSQCYRFYCVKFGFSTCIDRFISTPNIT